MQFALYQPLTISSGAYASWDECYWGSSSPTPVFPLHPFLTVLFTRDIGIIWFGFRVILLLLQHSAAQAAAISGSGQVNISAPIPYWAAEFILCSG